MPRKSKGWKVYWRGKAAWVWWPDGRGGKVRHRIADACGRKLMRQDETRTLNAAAAAMYEEWCRNIETIESGSERPLPSQVTVGYLTHEHAISHYNSWHKKTINAYILAYRNLEEYFNVDCRIASLTPLDCDKLSKWMARHGGRNGRPLSSRTVYNRITLLNTVFRWGIRMEIIEKNPFSALKPIEYEDTYKKRPFSPDETKRLLNTAMENFPYFYPVVLFLALTGSRRGVVPYMEVRDFDSKAGTLIARDEISKCKKGQIYHLPESICEALKMITEGREPNERLFRNEKGGRLTEKSFDLPANLKRPGQSCIWYRLLQAADVEYRGVHNLRRSAVSILAKSDATMEKITAVTGQTVEIARSHYLKIDPESQRQTMEKLSDIYAVEKSLTPQMNTALIDAKSGPVISPRRITLQLSDPEADALTRMLTLYEDSGTKSGTNGHLISLRPRKFKGSTIRAEREGFEPSMRFPTYSLSRGAPSATRPPLRG